MDYDPNEPMVLVELVREIDFKDDCRNYTDIVWVGQGDVQKYPKRLWPKLREHHDTWRLVTQAAPSAEELDRLEAENAQLRAQVAAGEGRDLITVDVVREWSAEDLAQLSDDDVRAEAAKRKFGLHARLSPEKIRPAFLEIQAARAVAPD